MKTSLSHVISFITMIFITSLVSFLVIQLNLRYMFLNRGLNKINYYNEAYDNIVLKIDENIVNNEIKIDYKEYISKDIIKMDIEKIILNKEYNISHYDEFYNIINKYTDDKDICSMYADMVNSIYVSNIFPIYEYKLIDKAYFEFSDCINYSLVIISIIMILELALYIINKDLKYNKITLLSSAFLCMVPFIFITITGTFNHFIYTNSYYTKFLIKIIDNIKNDLYLFGLIVFVIIYTLEKLKKTSRK